MKNYPIWKSFLVIILVLSGIIFSIPSIIYNEESNNWFLKNKINLGLDLQGGSYLLLEVQLDVLYSEELENFSDSVRLIAREKQIKINKILVQENEVIINFDNNKNINEVRDSFFQMYRDVSLKINNNNLIIKLDDIYKKIYRTQQLNNLLKLLEKELMNLEPKNL